MTRLLFLSIILSVAARADIFTPIDVHKQADLSGKTVTMPMLNFDTVTQPTRGQPVSPLTGKRTAPGKIVETKYVDLETLAPSATVQTRTVPQSNFTPKHGVVDTSIVPMANVPAATVPSARARINERVIRPQTPEGTEELKKQFTQPQK